MDEESESITAVISPDHPLLNEVTPETGKLLHYCYCLGSETSSVSSYNSISRGSNTYFAMKCITKKY